MVDGIHFRDAFRQYFPAAEYGRVGLHGALHVVAYFSGAQVAGGMADAVEARQGRFGGRGTQGLVRSPRFDLPGRAQGRGAPEHDEVQQAVRTEAVGAVHRHAGRFADGHEAGHDAVGVAVLQRHHLSVVIGRDAAHVVVHRGQDGNGRPADIHPGEDAGRLGDARQALVNDFRPKVFQVQVQVVPFRAYAAAFPDLYGHGAADHVPGCQVLRIRRVTLHEPLAGGIGQVTALAAHPFGDQHTGAVDAGGVELDELHVLQGQSGAQYHGVAVTGAGMGRGTGEIGAAVTPRRQDYAVGAKTVQVAFLQVPGQHAPAHAFLVHDQVDGEIFDEKLGVVFQGLLVQGVQDGMAGAVRCRAGALRGAFAVVGGHAAEGALVDLAVAGARERHPVMLQFNHRGGGFLAHVLDGVLVAQPVRPLDGVVHVPAPVVLAHVAQGRAHAPLRGHGMAAGGEHLGDARGFQPFLRHAEGGAQAGAAGAYDHHVVFMFDEWVGRAHFTGPC